MIALVCQLVLAQGAEDAAERAYAASESFEAVLFAGEPGVGSPTTATLLLADYATSAPVDADVKVTLSGPGSVDLALTTHDGVGTGAITFPAAGEYAGSLVVTTATATDLLAITGLVIAPEAVADHVDGWAWAGLCTTLGLVAGIGLLTGVVGYAVGRRRGMAVAAVLALGAPSERVGAHGGEDHGAPAVEVSGGALVLRMESQFLLGLRTMPVAMGPFREQIQATGTFVARPGESATVGAPASGVLVAPPGGFPTPGARVDAGQLLARIEETARGVDRAALGQARSEAGTRVAEARAALALAERDAANADALGDAISARERVQREQAVTVAREALSQAQGARSSAGVDGLEIRAPLGGTLGHVGVRPGERVEAGAPVFRISDVVGLWVEARVPERLAPGIAPGVPATVTTESGAVLDATVLDAGQHADPATGTVLVTLSVQTADAGILPGFGARVWIGRGDARDALALPSGAVVNSNGATLAFVKTGPEQFDARELRIGGRAGGAVEVLAGVRPGERVVTDGTYALRSIAGR